MIQPLSVNPSALPERFGARFVTRGLLGRGGFGVVALAQDTLLGGEAAVKWLPGLSPARRAALRREVTALRAVSWPGVVALLDEGEQDGGLWLGMERVHGAPFPGGVFDQLQGPLRDRAVALLLTLERLHRAGVVHRDLKPQNVLVRPDGLPVLLDLGLAVGRGVTAGGADEVAGTPRYQAPEQARGEAVDGRADLYALGVMLTEALTGLADPWAIHELHPTTLAALRALTAPDPDDRPASARAALALLGVEPERRRLPEGDPLPSSALRGLFWGPDVGLHLAEDAAEALWRVTEGRREAVAATLDAWQREGLASDEGGRLRVSREALRQLTPLAAGPEAIEEAEEAGRVEEAMARVEHQLAATRAQGGDEVPWLRTLTRLALSLQRAPALRRALYELGRAACPWPEGEALLHGANRSVEGDGPGALALLDGLGPVEDPRLEVWRHALRVHAAIRCGDAVVAAVLASIAPLAEHNPELSASLDGWRGLVAYREERYAEAVALHLRAAQGKPTRAGRLSSRLSAASAQLDAGQLDAAFEEAEALAKEAAALRHTLFELRALWIKRSAATRAGRPLHASPELVEAARAAGALLAQIALGEAAIAWRAGQTALALSFAEEAERAFAREHQPGVILARALLLTLRPAKKAERVKLARALAAEARRCPIPGLSLQALALCAAIVPGVDAGSVVKLAARLPPALQGGRLELLSGEECLGLVGAGGTILAPPPPDP